MVVVCHTNLDLRGEKWPDCLDSLPRVGDIIQSATERNGGFHLELEVCRVVWKHHKSVNEWIPHIELHMTSWQKQLTSPDDEWGKSPGSIRAFYHWYAPLVGTSVHYFI